MIGFVEAPVAYGLAQGMARAAGVALARAVVEGWITRRDLAEIVTRCQTCASADACTRWLATLRAELPPEFCANRQDLAALAPLR